MSERKMLLLTAESYVTILSQLMVAAFLLSLIRSFSALSACFFQTLGVKSGFGMSPQLCRPRALCTVRCMVARAALLLRASARTLLLRFLSTAAEIAPIRRN